MKSLYIALLSLILISCQLYAMKMVTGYRKINRVVNNSSEDVYLIMPGKEEPVLRIGGKTINPGEEQALEMGSITLTGSIYPAKRSWVVKKLSGETHIGHYLPQNEEVYLATQKGILHLPKRNIAELVISETGEPSIR
jgi:hypothetical protein